MNSSSHQKRKRYFFILLRRIFILQIIEIMMMSHFNFLRKNLNLSVRRRRGDFVHHIAFPLLDHNVQSELFPKYYYSSIAIALPSQSDFYDSVVVLLL